MFKIDFRELSFNQKIAVLIGGLVLIIGVLIGIGFAIKSVQNLTQPKPVTTEFAEPAEPSGSIKIPEIIDYEIKNETSEGNEYSDYISNYFSEEELGDIGAVAYKATIELCTKSLNETEESISNRLSTYFAKPSNWIYKNGSDSILEAKCSVGGLGPNQINTKNKTIKYEVYGTRYTISSSEYEKPAPERLIKENDFTYMFIIEKSDNKWIIIGEEF